MDNQDTTKEIKKGLLRRSWLILIVGAVVASGIVFYLQQRGDRFAEDAQKVQLLIRMRSLKEADLALQQFEKTWGDVEIVHLLRARWFRQKLDQPNFEQELKLAKSKGLSELQVRNERNLFYITIGNFNGFSGDYGAFVNNGMSDYEDNTIALLEGLIYRNDLVTLKRLRKCGRNQTRLRYGPSFTTGKLNATNDPSRSLGILSPSCIESIPSLRRFGQSSVKHTSCYVSLKKHCRCSRKPSLPIPITDS